MTDRLCQGEVHTALFDLGIDQSTHLTDLLHPLSTVQVQQTHVRCPSHAFQLRNGPVLPYIQPPWLSVHAPCALTGPSIPYPHSNPSLCRLSLILWLFPQVICRTSGWTSDVLSLSSRVSQKTGAPAGNVPVVPCSSSEPVSAL